MASTWFRSSEGRYPQHWPLGKGTQLQMFDLSAEGGRTRLRQRSPLRLKTISPPRLLGTAVLPAVPSLTSHSTPMPALLLTSGSLCRQLDQQLKCRLKLLSSIITSSSVRVPSEIKQNFSGSPRGAAPCRKRGAENITLSLSTQHYHLSGST